MGHYDDAYEADAEKREKQLRNDRQKALKKLREFLEQGAHILPERHLGYLEDIEIGLKYHLS